MPPPLAGIVKSFNKGSMPSDEWFGGPGRVPHQPGEPGEEIPSLLGATCGAPAPCYRQGYFEPV